MKKILSAFLASMLLLLLASPSGFAAINQTDLDSYLTEINMTQAELEDYLLYYEITLDEYESIDELRDMLGPALNPESLQTLLDDYDMTEAELTSLLIEYGEMEQGEQILDTFHFVSDIENIILLDQGLGDVDWTELFDGLSSEFGLEEAEFERLFDYLEPVFEAPGFEEQFMALGDRMMQFEEFETLDDLTAEQVAELLSIYDDLQNILQVHFQYTLINNGTSTSLSTEELFKLTELNDAKLNIAIYDINGNPLLDLVITGDMFDSYLIQEVGQDLKEAPSIIEQVKSAPRTVKGGLLPKTAGNYFFYTVMGLLMMGCAYILFKRAKLMK